MLEIILADLRQRFGDKVLLSPEDLASVIGVSVGQQANQRSQNKFPIPHKVEGRRVKVSIYDLAVYLAGIGSSSVRAEIKAMPDTLTRRAKKQVKGRLQQGWWLFHCPMVVSIISKSILELELIATTEPARKLNKI